MISLIFCTNFWDLRLSWLLRITWQPLWTSSEDRATSNMQKIVQKLHETVTQSKSQYCAINFCTKWRPLWTSSGHLEGHEGCRGCFKPFSDSQCWCRLVFDFGEASSLHARTQNRKLTCIVTMQFRVALWLETPKYPYLPILLNRYVHSAFSRKKHQSISVTVDCKTNLVSSVKCQGFVFIRPAFFVWLSKQIKMLLTLTTLALLSQTLHLLLTSGKN